MHTIEAEKVQNFAALESSGRMYHAHVRNLELQILHGITMFLQLRFKP